MTETNEHDELVYADPNEFELIDGSEDNPDSDDWDD